MPRVTPRDPTRPMVAYTTRNLYADLLGQVRVLAATEGTTMEDTINWLLERGLASVEGDTT